MARFDHIARSRRKHPLGALKVDREGRASPGLRFDRDRPAHPPHELARDVEAEPRAAARSGELRVEAIELLEDPLLLSRGDADAGVLHRDAYTAGRGADRDDDAAAVGRVLDGVVEEV